MNLKKFFLLFLGTFVLCLVSLWAYLAIGASVLGPKADVGQACNAISVSMTVPEVRDAIRPFGEMDVFQYENASTLQVSQVKGDWICVCKVRLQSDSSNTLTVAAVDNVFCSD